MALPDSSVHGIFERILEQVAISYFRGSSPPRDFEPLSLKSSALESTFFTTSAIREVLFMAESRSFMPVTLGWSETRWTVGS